MTAALRVRTNTPVGRDSTPVACSSTWRARVAALRTLVAAMCLAMGCAARTVDWSVPPKIDAPAALTSPRANELRLANGVRVIVVENHRLPVVAITAVH